MNEMEVKKGLVRKYMWWYTKQFVLIMLLIAVMVGAIGLLWIFEEKYPIIGWVELGLVFVGALFAYFWGLAKDRAEKTVENLTRMPLEDTSTEYLVKNGDDLVKAFYKGGKVMTPRDEMARFADSQREGD